MTPTPTEIIADRIAGVCTVDPADVAAAIVTRLEREGWKIRRKDRWETRNGRAVVIASNDWPPPQPGTHESDLVDVIDGPECQDHTVGCICVGYMAAARWSHQNNPERNPQ